MSTIHSAKGLEWDVVYVMHAADGNIPSDLATGNANEIEEERRLFYVALTRAKDWLYVCFPMRYYKRAGGMGDGHTYAQLTRFLAPAMLDCCAQQPAKPPAEKDAPDTALTTGACSTLDAEIRQRIRSTWS